MDSLDGSSSSSAQGSASDKSLAGPIKISWFLRYLLVSFASIVLARGFNY